jgi:hypothetical protein
MPLLFVFMLFRHTGTPLPLISRETGLTCEEISHWHASGTRIEHRVERVSTSRGRAIHCLDHRQVELFARVGLAENRARELC